MRVNTALLRDCRTEEQRRARKEFLASHLEMLKLLREVIDYAMKEARESHLSDGYESPAWAYKQADLNGQLRAYNHMLEIIKTSEDSND